MAAVEHLDVRPADHILEIGGGRGLAAALICARLDGGRLVGIDRSATATAAAAAHNADAVAAGTARFLTLALEDADPAGLGRFHKVFAVNVNLFWVRPAQRELRLIGNLLWPGGRLVLCYDPPDLSRLTRLDAMLTEHLAAAGFRVTATAGADRFCRTAELVSAP